VAVLLESLLDRVHVLEERLNKLTPTNNSVTSSLSLARSAEILATMAATSDRKPVNARGFSSQL